MYNGTYANSSTHASAPGQDPSTSNSNTGEVNADGPPANDLPLPKQEFQPDAPGLQFDFSQPFTGPPSQHQAQAPSSHFQSAFLHPLAIPFLTGSSGQVYGGTPSLENVLNNVAGPSTSWEGGGHPSVPYGQPTQTNAYSGQTGEGGTSFASNPPNESATSFPPPPPGGYAPPNAQGIYADLWRLSDIRLVNEGSGSLCLIIQLKMIPNRSA